MIEGPCLVLNRSYLPVQVTSIKRAISLVFRGMAKIVDKQYQLYDFKSWADLTATLSLTEPSNGTQSERIHMTHGSIEVPRVILLSFYDKLPQRRVRLNRQNIFLRDQNTCQYCGVYFKRQDLNIDHVVPVSQGGLTTWSNVVCSCIPCNSKKGGRTPAQANMNLLSKPDKPPYSIFMHISPKPKLVDYWKTYMNPIDFAYWCLELK